MMMATEKGKDKVSRHRGVKPRPKNRRKINPGIDGYETSSD